MQRLQWAIILSAIGAILLAAILFGWPRNLEEAGGFAGFVTAVLTPASLLLLVATLEKQEDSQRQQTRDGFLAVQVQALIALIEDDRAMLESMAAKYHATKQKSDAFPHVQKRYRERVNRLNAILGKELKLPELAETKDA